MVPIRELFEYEGKVRILFHDARVQMEQYFPGAGLADLLGKS